MRVTVDCDDAFLAKAMEATGRKTKKAVVEEALRQLIRNSRHRRDSDGPPQVRDIDPPP